MFLDAVGGLIIDYLSSSDTLNVTNLLDFTDGLAADNNIGYGAYALFYLLFSIDCC
jgi:hypothetical protein